MTHVFYSNATQKKNTKIEITLWQIEITSFILNKVSKK
jgi:hypothetical protein